MAEWLSMQRSVSQLLFHYLPGRTVDWEDGLAIVQLTQVRFSSIWPGEQAAAVLEEMAFLFERWRRRGGSIDPQFPDPRTRTGEFASRRTRIYRSDRLRDGICLSELFSAALHQL